MNGMITIENLTGKHLQFRVNHKEVCVKIGRCLCRKGRRSVEALTIHVPGFGRTAPLFAGVAESQAIKNAANGIKPTIKIVGHVPRAKPKAAAASDEEGYTEGHKASTGRKGQYKKGKATN